MLPPPPGTFQDREDLIRHVRDFGANQGYVVTIKKSRKDRRVILGCDRGGVYRNRRKIEESKRKRKASSRLINCPFEAVGKKGDDAWVLTIKNGEHNHEPLRDMSEHPYSRRFTEEEVRQIKLMTEAGVKPRQVLKALKHSNPDLQSTPRHLYNLKAKIRQGNFSERSCKSWRPNRSIPVNAADAEASSRHAYPLKVPNLIGGKFLESQSCEIIDVVNPATQEIVSQVPLTTYEEFKAAVSAARLAFPSWRNTPVTARQRIMFKLQELIHRDIEKIAMNITVEQGKTLKGAEVDVLHGLEVVEQACGMAALQVGEFVPNASNGIDTCCIREPLGVCAGICPLSFPATISLWMFPIAITCGNTFVLKPSEKNPGASMILAALATEAGLPKGVLNIVHGTNDIVNLICDDDDVKAISFIDSNTAGMHLYAKAAATGKRVLSNMSAKNYAIIMPDARMDSTLDSLVSSGFGAAGQSYMALNIAVFVGGSVRWEEELVERARALEVNVGTESTADLGPVISKEAKDQVVRLVNSAVEQGARLVLDGRDIVVPGYENGNFVGPTILCDVTPEMECCKEEIFGPVLLCMQADSIDEAIIIVNSNKYGKGASIFTTSGVAARKLQNEAEAARVGINIPVPVLVPFSSSKASLAGDLNFCGKEGLEFYTRIKTTVQRWDDLPHEGLSLHAPPTSDTDITSRGVSVAFPSTSESDSPARGVSPVMPVITTTSKTDVESQRMFLSAPSMANRDSQAMPQTIFYHGNPPPSSQRTEHIPPTLERMYMSPASQTNENTMATASERVYIPAASFRSDAMSLTSQEGDTMVHPTCERIYIPAASQGNTDFGQTSQRADNNMHPTIQRCDVALHPTSERVYIPTALHGNDGMVLSSQRMYNSQNPIIIMEDYSNQGVLLALPTSPRNCRT